MSKERLNIDEILEHCKRRVSWYERIKSREFLEDENNSIKVAGMKEYWEHRQVAEYLEELKQYRDLEEQGFLLRLPCKVGDTVWELCKCNDNVYRIFPMVVKQVIPNGSVRWIKGKEPTVWNIYAISDYTDMYKAFCDFGETVFLTQAEAEEKLRELEGK